MIEFLDWVARAGGVVAILVAVLGYIFREKWKQILQRSLAEDLERLKADLAKDQVAHAASLTPQLEQIKHDFQQKLEAYKVSLIAEAEAVKAKGELRKNIALRYAENEFQRLVELEHVASPIAAEILSWAQISVEYKRVEQKTMSLDKTRELGGAIEAAGMYLTPEEQLALVQFRKKVLNIIMAHIGVGMPVLAGDDDQTKDLLKTSVEIDEIVRARIKALAAL